MRFCPHSRDQLTLNQRVQGSSPCAPTNKIKYLLAILASVASQKTTLGQHLGNITSYPLFSLKGAQSYSARNADWTRCAAHHCCHRGDTNLQLQLWHCGAQGEAR